MEIFTVDDLLAFTKGIGFTRREIDDHISLVGDTLKDCIDEDILHFYPKGITSDEDDNSYFELIAFLKNKVVVGTYLSDYTVNIKSFPLDEQMQIDMTVTRYEGSLLSVTLSNGKQLVFDSNNDCNRHWRRKYDEKIKETIKFLMKK